MASRRLPLAIFLSLCSLVTSNPIAPVITPAPHVPRQAVWEAMPNWMGYYWETISGTRILQTHTCPTGFQFATSNSFGGCCTISSTSHDCKYAIATSCIRNSVVMMDGRTLSCYHTPGAYCQGWTVYPGSTTHSTNFINYMFCAVSMDTLSLFKQIPIAMNNLSTQPSTASTTTSHDVSELSGLPPPQTNTAPPTSIPTSTPPSSSLSAIIDSSLLPSGRRNLSWIAGVVIGVIAFFALIALGIVHWRKRAKKQNTSLHDSDATKFYTDHTCPQHTVNDTLPHEKQANTVNEVAAELPGESEPSELPAAPSSPIVVGELEIREGRSGT